MEFFLRVEYADMSLLGGREENQDRVVAAVAERAALLVVVDGMGGHADGARAATATQRVILDAFSPGAVRSSRTTSSWDAPTDCGARSPTPRSPPSSAAPGSCAGSCSSSARAP